MAKSLLHQEKAAATAKLQLALFTKSLADEKALGARVAQLEQQHAGAALSSGHDEEAFCALVAAATAHQALGDLHAAASCLERAQLLEASDAEAAALLAQALADLRSQLYKPALKSKPAPKPEPKKEEAKVTPEPEAKEEQPKPEPKKEEAKADEAPKPEAKKAKRKKDGPKS